MSQSSIALKVIDSLVGEVAALMRVISRIVQANLDHQLNLNDRRFQNGLRSKKTDYYTKELGSIEKPSKRHESMAVLL